jgi:DHA2 family multidrug resistance protein-like MFS transporter
VGGRQLVLGGGARVRLDATAFAKQITASPNADQVSSNVEAQLTKSFSSAANTASQYPQYAKQITSAAKTSFVDGANWAYTAGIVAILVGAALVFFLFPKRDGEEALLAEYHAEDTASDAAITPSG